MEKPPLSKVPKLKLDLVANDKTDRSLIMIAHNMDSKKALDVSVVTIAIENDHDVIGVKQSVP